MCNHNYNDPDNTLKLSPKRMMVTPTTYFFYCKECGKVITVQDENLNVKDFE